MNILPVRADFLWAAQKGQKAGGPHLLLQGVGRRPTRRIDPASTLVRIGFTASKKVGNAPRRARAKRRMRELARRHVLPHAKPAHDYVLIARDLVCHADFAVLEAETQRLMRQLNQRLSGTAARNADAKRTQSDGQKPRS